MIEFLALHPLEECVKQLRDARSTEIEPTVERTDSNTYKVRLRRMRRDRTGRLSSMVEANLHLRSMSANETTVVGSVRFSWGVIIGTVVFAVVLIASLFMREVWLAMVVVFVMLTYWAFVWWDRQTIVGLVKRRLGERRNGE
jgi:Flp pilus assembly protein TadB